MNVFLSSLGNLAIIVFTVTSMISVGLGYSWQELLAPMRNLGAVVKTLVANFILVPLIAIVLVRFLDLQPAFAIGLFLVSAAAGAAFTVKLAEVSRTDVAQAAAVLLVLLPATVIYMPLVLPRILPDVAVSAWAIARPLIWMLLVPLGAALVFEQIWPSIGARLRPLMSKTSSVALIVLIVALLLANVGAITSLFGSGAIVAAVLFILGAFAAGYLLGGRRRGTRYVVGFATSQRNYGAALIVGSQTLTNETAMVMIVVTSVLGLVVLFPLARFAERRHERTARSVRERTPIKLYETPLPLPRRSPIMREV